MDDIRSLVKAAGGLRKAAKAIGVPWSTINSWQRANRVPEWRIDKLEALKRASQAAA